MYVPFTVQNRAMQQYEAEQATSIALANELDLLSHQVEFLNLSFDKQQAVMREVECLAQNIYFEAGSEPMAGKIAVATVTLNRVKEGFARSICGVVKQKRNGVCQFSWVCSNDKVIRSTENYYEAQKIAQNILISKKNYGTMDNALYFHADYVNPNWKQTKEFVKKIGRHLFYKES
jgi:spore germination cell wall hydrolase CwlJ-like protein